MQPFGATFASLLFLKSGHLDGEGLLHETQGYIGATGFFVITCKIIKCKSIEAVTTRVPARLTLLNKLLAQLHDKVDSLQNLDSFLHLIIVACLALEHVRGGQMLHANLAEGQHKLILHFLAIFYVELF